MKQNIILIGMPGTGKSTVGVVLAKRLGYDFLDSDLLLAREAGMTLPEILKTMGVDRFLELEGRVGAGIKCSGTVIWLETRIYELERRISRNPDRGIAAGPDTSVADIYAARRPLYEKYADVRIKCRRGVDPVVSQILDALKDIL